MTTYNQDRDFKKAVVIDNLPDSLLQDAIDWVGKNMDPEDVFSEHDLTTWAESMGFVKEKSVQE